MASTSVHRGIAAGALSHVRKVDRTKEQKRPALPVSPPRRTHRIGTPYESDYKIAKFVALFLVREPDAAFRRKMWEPWFLLQGPCHHWVDLLVDYIYCAATQADEHSSQFPALMRELFEHALADGGWLDGRARDSFRTSDIARAFLGFGDLSPGDFWIAARAPSALALAPYWPQWIGVAMSQHRCASSFFRMLRQPAFATLRPSCLEWLDRKDRASWMSDEEAPLALVRLLEVVWAERDVEDHDLVGPVRDLFERLLNDLVAGRLPDAVQLSMRVARGE